MVISSTRIGFVLLGIISALIANIPSLKIIAPPTMYVNFTLFVLFFMVVVSLSSSLSHKIIISDDTIRGILLFALLLLLGMLPFIWSGYQTNVRYFGGLLYTGLVFSSTLIFANTHTARYYILTQFLWSFSISVLYLLGFVDYSGPGQHYNTIAVPAALGLIISISAILYYKNSTVSILGVTSSIIFMIALLSLGGRGPFVGIPAVFGLLLLLYYVNTFSDPQPSKIIGSILIPPILILLFIGLFIQLGISEYHTERMARLVTNPTAEPRIDLYYFYIQEIFQNPFGMGLGTSEFYGGYPHNIVLHATYIGGWINGIVSIALFIYLFKFLRSKIIFSSPIYMSVSLISVYMFFIFSISYSIHSSYMLFIPLAIGFSLMIRQRYSDI